MNSCIICGKKVVAKGLCNKHYYQQPHLKLKKKLYDAKIRKEPSFIIKNKLYEQKRKPLKKKYDKISYVRNYEKHQNYRTSEEVKRRKRIRYRTDVEYRLTCIMRARMREALKYNYKRGNSVELLGCNSKQLKQHIENQFTSGMSWENYGEWHIDHITPCCSFNMKDMNSRKKCFHYSNLRPLWANENLARNRPKIKI